MSGFSGGNRGEGDLRLPLPEGQECKVDTGPDLPESAPPDSLTRDSGRGDELERYEELLRRDSISDDVRDKMQEKTRRSELFQTLLDKALVPASKTEENDADSDYVLDLTHININEKFGSIDNFIQLLKLLDKEFDDIDKSEFVSEGLEPDQNPLESAFSEVEGSDD